MASTQFDRDVAVEAAEENYSLQKRLARLEAEEEQQRRAAECENRIEDSATVSSLDRAKRRNAGLRDEIATLEAQLKELQTINVVELQHEYQRLDTRRSTLLNEISSLRRVIANQSKDVRRATRAVNDQQELRRQNEAQHASTNADIQMFRAKREALATETQRLIRKERHIESELQDLPTANEDPEVVASRLRRDNERKDHTIERLEAELQEAQQMAAEQAPVVSSVDDLKELKEEYVRLNDQLRQLKK